jgi:cytidine deaminase
MDSLEQLVDAARAARERAYAPYSGFQVGAALRCASGSLYSGCNVENASYGLTICAERVALVSAVAAGERHVTSLAVVTDDRELTAPCGACRQFLAEFAADDLPVILVNLRGDREVTTLGALLPRAFRAFGKE